MKKKILIADDDQEVGDFFSDILAAAGYETACCDKGGDVEVTIAGFGPDLLLLDAMLPGVDGLTLARRITANPATAALPIIVVTGLVVQVTHNLIPGRPGGPMSQGGIGDTILISV
jgi:DNA-binding response OmpR family regulator